MIVKESDDQTYFWFYINLKRLIETDLGAVLMFFRLYSTMEENSVYHIVHLVLKGKSIRQYFKDIPLSIKSRLNSPRYNLESWKETNQIESILHLDTTRHLL